MIHENKLDVELEEPQLGLEGASELLEAPLQQLELGQQLLATEARRLDGPAARRRIDKHRWPAA